jgi:hypothetical protein
MKKSAAKPAPRTTEPTLKPGWWVAVVLKPGAAPLRCYVGQIQTIDAQGPATHANPLDCMNGDG